MPYQSGGISFGDAVPEEIIYRRRNNVELGWINKSSEYKSEGLLFI